MRVAELGQLIAWGTDDIQRLEHRFNGVKLLKLNSPDYIDFLSQEYKKAKDELKELTEKLDRQLTEIFDT